MRLFYIVGVLLRELIRQRQPKNKAKNREVIFPRLPFLFQTTPTSVKVMAPPFWEMPPPGATVSLLTPSCVLPFVIVRPEKFVVAPLTVTMRKAGVPPAVQRVTVSLVEPGPVRVR